jgi:hypothetical protein
MTIGKDILDDIKKRHEEKMKAIREKQLILKDYGNTEKSK